MQQQLPKIVKFTTLKKNLLQISLVQEKNNLAVAKKKLDQLEARQDQIKLNFRKFKPKFLSFLIRKKLATKFDINKRYNNKYKMQLEQMSSQINQQESQIADIEEKIQQLYKKIQRAEVRLIKYDEIKNYYQEWGDDS